MNPISKALSVLKKSHINKAYRRIEPHLPKWFNRRVAAMSDRYIFKALILVDELKPQYKKAFSLLRKELADQRLGDYLEFGVCHGTSSDAHLAQIETSTN